MGGDWERDLAPVIGNGIQFSFEFIQYIFQNQASMILYILYFNYLFVQKKNKTGAFPKQGSGLIHSLVQESPEKDDVILSCSLDCAKYPLPLQSKVKPSLWLLSPAAL